MSNFTIRDSCRHLAVDLRIIDAEIEKAFGLSHLDYRGATDLYSQFYFSEPEVILHQKSISWVGLIDTIIYYSDISYGPTSIYDIEAAMEHVRLYSIFFPKSASLFLSKIIEFLDQNGYYIFVEIHSEYEDKDERVYYDIQGNNCLSISRYGILKYSHGELLEVTPVLGTWLDYDSKWPDGINKLSQKLEYQINNHSIKLPEAA